MPQPSARRVLPPALIVLAVVALVLARVAMPGREPVGPNPALAPGEVVRLQLEALQHNDRPSKDHGIKVAYRFASPDNKSKTGPLMHFAALIHAGYADMLNFRKVVYLPVLQRDSVAFQAVVLFTDLGPSRYVFILSRQAGEPCPRCWMTDAVIRVQSTKELGTLI